MRLKPSKPTEKKVNYDYYYYILADTGAPSLSDIIKYIHAEIGPDVDFDDIFFKFEYAAIEIKLTVPETDEEFQKRIEYYKNDLAAYNEELLIEYSKKKEELEDLKKKINSN